MIINTSNIELLFFDYFEGNLSELDKKQLLNFIHENPSYQREFALWAQSYASEKDDPKDYGMTSSLLKKEAFPWTKIIVPVALLIVFFGGMYFGFQNSNDTITQSKKSKKETEKVNKPLLTTAKNEVPLLAKKAIPTNQQSHIKTTKQSTNDIKQDLIDTISIIPNKSDLLAEKDSTKNEAIETQIRTKKPEKQHPILSIPPKIYIPKERRKPTLKSNYLPVNSNL